MVMVMASLPTLVPLLGVLALSSAPAGALRAPPPPRPPKPMRRAPPAPRGRAGPPPGTAAPARGGGPSRPGSRRAFQDGAGAGVAAACAASGWFRPTDAVADGGDDPMIDVYFGCGCFWHVQHELVEAERRILGRSDEELTARAGYAGGRAGALDGKVCYHNFGRVSDYGPLGHAEVVSLRVPASSYKEFAAEYAKLFDRNGYRPDQAGDRGSEYRNLVGFPGGAKSEAYLRQLVEASKENGDKLAFAEGLGDDPDRRALVFVMDSDAFPPFVAEQYHQFHDGFAPGEGYPQSYNDIAAKLARAGALGQSNCPNGMLRI